MYASDCSDLESMESRLLTPPRNHSLNLPPSSIQVIRLDCKNGPDKQPGLCLRAVSQSRQSLDRGWRVACDTDFNERVQKPYIWQPSGFYYDWKTYYAGREEPRYGAAPTDERH